MPMTPRHVPVFSSGDLGWQERKVEMLKKMIKKRILEQDLKGGGLQDGKAIERYKVKKCSRDWKIKS
jgi:hypothetical protein